MCGSPDGYGSISSTYEAGLLPSSPLETCHVRSSSQMRCHLGSITCGSKRCSDAMGRGGYPSAMRTSVRIRCPRARSRVRSPRRRSRQPRRARLRRAAPARRGSPLRPRDRHRAVAAARSVQMGSAKGVGDHRQPLHLSTHASRVRVLDLRRERDRRGGDLLPRAQALLLSADRNGGRSACDVSTSRSCCKQPEGRDKLRGPVRLWGYSSAGRASRWQHEGRRFEPD